MEKAEADLKLAKQRSDNARKQLDASKKEVKAAEQQVVQFKEQAKEAEEAAKKALKNALFAEFEAWQTQLSAASKTGDYATALSVVEQMLEADNQFVRESEEAFLELRDALRKNQSPLEGRANSAAISSKGNALAVAGAIRGDDQIVAVWNIDKTAGIGEEPNKRIRLKEDVRSVSVSPHGRFVATQSDAGVTVWTADGRQLCDPLGKTRHSTVVRFSKSGDELLVGTKHGAVHVFAVNDTGVRRVGGQELGNYRVADVLWQIEDSGRGYLIVILTGTRQVLVGSIAFESRERKLSLPAKRSNGTPYKWTQLELPCWRATADVSAVRIIEFRVSRDYEPG